MALLRPLCILRPQTRFWSLTFRHPGNASQALFFSVQHPPIQEQALAMFIWGNQSIFTWHAHKALISPLKPTDMKVASYGLISREMAGATRLSLSDPLQSSVPSSMDLLVLTVGDVGPKVQMWIAEGPTAVTAARPLLLLRAPGPRWQKALPSQAETHLSRWMQRMRGHQHSMVRQGQSGLAHCPLPVALKVPSTWDDFRKTSERQLASREVDADARGSLRLASC